ncbi:UNVERIFIED_CONTAM: hypothetical protein Scaly_2742900 [Sesamum calycinum]|uniref:Integrase zinc-binding domain-containing protein n=1 Tax=Sesamum calycinum TaxID=2727403 RepID=A0AAW2J249_9LAMI
MLYQRSLEGTYQHCLRDEKVLEAMTEAHLGVCGAHQSSPKLHFMIKRMGYYWPTMVKDCLGYAKKSTNDFSKWAEAIPLKKVKKETVVDFIGINIIFRYGVPRYIITDNRRPFYNKSIGEAPWAYRTMHRTATQATPYSLLYDVEVILPLESQIPSLHIAV